MLGANDETVVHELGQLSKEDGLAHPGDLPSQLPRAHRAALVEPPQDRPLPAPRKDSYRRIHRALLLRNSR